MHSLRPLQRSSAVCSAIVRARAEAKLRECGERVRSLAEGIPQLVRRAVGYGNWSWASPQWTAFTGQPAEDSCGWGWLDVLHSDDRHGARDAGEQAQKTGPLQADYRLRHRANGEYRWFQTPATPVRDGGKLVAWLGTSIDVQDINELQERQQLLPAELQHRVRNVSRPQCPSIGVAAAAMRPRNCSTACSSAAYCFRAYRRFHSQRVMREDHSQSEVAANRKGEDGADPPIPLLDKRDGRSTPQAGIHNAVPV